MSTTSKKPPSTTARGWLTIDEICTELCIAKSTFHDWRAKGRAPKCVKLPNGSLRVKRSDFEKFMTALEEAA